jgi:hypothetical protein
MHDFATARISISLYSTVYEENIVFFFIRAFKYIKSVGLRRISLPATRRKERLGEWAKG